MGSHQNDVFQAIFMERVFQNQKHGDVDKVPHTPAGWLLLIRKELEEAEHSLIKGGMGRDAWRHELIQVAALCVACLEQHGLNSPDPFVREI